jgi:electron transfer flavoprotein beta subunit
LDIPQLTYVCKIRAIDPRTRNIEVERLLEEGREVVRTGLPALLTVVKDINQPRYPSLRGIRTARKLVIPVWTPADLPNVESKYLGLDGSPTKVVKVFSPPKREGKVEFIPAETVEAAADILSDKILAEKVV